MSRLADPTQAIRPKRLYLDLDPGAHVNERTWARLLTGHGEGVSIQLHIVRVPGRYAELLPIRVLPRLAQ